VPAPGAEGAKGLVWFMPAPARWLVGRLVSRRSAWGWRGGVGGVRRREAAVAVGGADVEDDDAVAVVPPGRLASGRAVLGDRPSFATDLRAAT
jgi:hypothetical protein